MQTPRILSAPSYVSSSGRFVVDLCREAGLILDPWQCTVLEHGLGETEDGRWASFEVGVDVARQNGKGELLMAREIGGLFLLDERVIIHTAHEVKTAEVSFRRTAELIENSPVLSRQLAHIHRVNGKESIELTSGAELKFLARSRSSGRGFTADLVVFDEAQIMDYGPVQATLPTLSTRPNPQIWYAGTTGEEKSIHLAGVRRRALAGGDPTLAYMEWSVDEDDYDPADPDDWALANPAMGIRISEDYIVKERAAFAENLAGFAAERLGVGDWPTGETFGVIPAERWAGCADPGPRPVGPVVLAVEANYERTTASIAVGGARADEMLVVEVVDQRNGLDWVVDRMVALDQTYRPVCTVVDVRGPAGPLVGPLQTAGLEVVMPTVQEIAQASEGFFDAVMEDRLRHQSDGRLDGAVAGAKQKPCGEAWAWGRRAATVNISPLVACSFALWGFQTRVGELGPDDVYVGG